MKSNAPQRLIKNIANLESPYIMPMHPAQLLIYLSDICTMCLVKVHKPISMNKHHLKSFMNCILIGKTPGIEIWMIQDDPKWFSGPNILNFLNYFCSNLPKFHYGGFLSIGLAIFWYNLSENVFGVLKFQKKNYFVSLTFPKCDTFNGNLTFLALVWT